MLKDRGTIKWTSLMLPEHVELLKQMWQANKKVAKPIIDAQMAEMLETELIKAYKHNESITVYYYDDGYIKQIIGKVISLNSQENNIGFTLDFDQTDKTVLFQDIISIF